MSEINYRKVTYGVVAYAPNFKFDILESKNIYDVDGIWESKYPYTKPNEIFYQKTIDDVIHNVNTKGYCLFLRDKISKSHHNYKSIVDAFIDNDLDFEFQTSVSGDSMTDIIMKNLMKSIKREEFLNKLLNE